MYLFLIVLIKTLEWNQQVNLKNVPQSPKIIIENTLFLMDLIQHLNDKITRVSITTFPITKL